MKGHALQLLALGDVRGFVAARFFAGLARSLLAATIAWHLWKVTGSKFQLGMLGAVEFLPVIPIALVAGAVADAFDRRRIVISTQWVGLLGAAGLCAGSALGRAELPLILSIAFVLSAITAVEAPANSSLLPGLVSREQFPTATVLSANVRHVAAVSGPVLMGFVVSVGGIPAAYGLAAGLRALAAASLWLVHSPPVEGGRTAVSLASIREGVAFVRAHSVILASISLDMFAVILASATALLPVFADQILGVGEVGYGMLSASMQVGTLAMAGLLLVLPPIDRPGRALLIAVLFFGLATVVFGLSRSFWLSLAAFAAAGMADQVSMVARSIILQLSTPDALRGRVNSVSYIFIGASNQLGAAESGFLAALTSATFSVVFGGVACLGVLGGIAAATPSLRRYRVTPVLTEVGPA